jgi:O-antigen/teichoic acid export membrane protein
MLQHLKKLGKHSLVYGTGLLLSKSIGFLLLPLYTNYLTPANYGVLELIDLTGFFIGFLVGAGVSDAVLKQYHKAESDETKYKVISTALVFSIVFGGVILAILLPITDKISYLVVGDAQYGGLFRLSLISVFIGSIVELEKAILRVQNSSILFTIASLFSTLLAASLNIYFIAILKIGLVGILYSSLISISIVGLYLTVRQIKISGIQFDIDELKSMLKYGLPFVPAGIFSFVLMWSDRYFLRIYDDVTAIGNYALGSKLAMIASFLVVTPFLLVWNAYIFEIKNRPDATEVYKKIATYFVFASCFVGLGISVLSYEMVTIIADPSYIKAYTVIPLLVLGIGLMTSDTVFQVGILIKGKSHFLPIAKGIAAICNVVLNVLLIPKYGIIGAAWATAISFLVYIMLIIRFAQKENHIPFEYIRMGKIFAVTMVLFFACEMVPTTNLFYSIPIKLVILAMYPLLLLPMRFYENNEIGVIKRVYLSIAGSK